MKRDMDLAREILFKIEEAPDFGSPIELAIEGRDEKEIDYHVMLLHQAGLIEAIGTSGFDYSEWIPTGMTWAGHEFLDAARDTSRWNRAKEIMKSKGTGMAFDVLKVVLVELSKASITAAIRGLRPDSL